MSTSTSAPPYGSQHRCMSDAPLGLMHTRFRPLPPHTLQPSRTHAPSPTHEARCTPGEVKLWPGDEARALPLSLPARSTGLGSTLRCIAPYVSA
eukprot:439946-Rhodomonas_salina.9